MSEELDQINSGADTEASPEPQISSDNTEQAGGQQAQSTTKEEVQTPFHEHPRWKELMEERNQERQKTQELEWRYRQLEQQLQQSSRGPQAPSKETALIERLKGIDPEFGGHIEHMWNKLGKMDQLEQSYQEVQSQSLQYQYQNGLQNLHMTNKVPTEWQPVYDRLIRAEAFQNPKLGIQDLPRVYQQVHEGVKGLIEAQKRSDRQSYVEQKKTDSSVPATGAKGTAAKQSQGKKEYSGDEFERRSQMVQDVLKDIRANNKGL